MSIPHDILLQGEEIIHETKLHWVGLIKEILYSVAYLAVFLILVVWWGPSWISWIMWPVTILWLVIGGIGVIQWLSTTLALTNRRVLFRKGVVSKKGYEIPVDLIQDVGFQQSVIQRMFGAGDLVVKTSASTGRTAIRNIPDPVGIKTMIGDARESKIEGRFERAADSAISSAATSGPTPTSSGRSRAEQLEILGRLRDEGKLSDAEFEAEKRRILEES